MHILRHLHTHRLPPLFILRSNVLCMASGPWISAFNRSLPIYNAQLRVCCVISPRWPVMTGFETGIRGRLTSSQASIGVSAGVNTRGEVHV
jgi:hypothetical protein